MTADVSNVAEESQPSALSWRNWTILAAYIFNAAITIPVTTAGAVGKTNNELADIYPVLVTPNRLAFSIWPVIFTWEAIFAGAQLLPQFRNSKLLELMLPGWVVACLFQPIWSIFFAFEQMQLALVCMLGILAGLMLIAVMTDGHFMSWSEFFALRGCISLHLGWITAATALNVSVTADSAKASPQVLLSLVVISVGVIYVLGTSFALVKKSPDPIYCCVLAWALNGISGELGGDGPGKLDNPDRHNPHVWDRATLEGLEMGAAYLSYLALALAVVAAVRALLLMQSGSNNMDSKRASSDPSQELSQSLGA